MCMCRLAQNGTKSILSQWDKRTPGNPRATLNTKAQRPRVAASCVNCPHRPPLWHARGSGSIPHDPTESQRPASSLCVKAKLAIKPCSHFILYSFYFHVHLNANMLLYLFYMFISILMCLFLAAVLPLYFLKVQQPNTPVPSGPLFPRSRF